MLYIVLVITLLTAICQVSAFKTIKAQRGSKLPGCSIKDIEELQGTGEQIGNTWYSINKSAWTKWNKIWNINLLLLLAQFISISLIVSILLS